MSYEHTHMHRVGSLGPCKKQGYLMRKTLPSTKCHRAYTHIILTEWRKVNNKPRPQFLCVVLFFSPP